MRLATDWTRVFVCALIAAPAMSLAQPPPGAPAPQCADKANLAKPAVTLGRVDYLSGGQPGSVSGGVLMIDFEVVVANNGGEEALRSRLRYEADVRDSAGKSAEKLNGLTDIYGIPAGAEERMPISLMVSNLAPLVQPGGEIAAAVALRIETDVDDEIEECDETDNGAEATFEIATGKVV